MGINKIVYGATTLIDLTGDDATDADVASGKKYHNRDGTQHTGTASSSSSSFGTLITTHSLGSISTTSTSATNLNKDLTVDVGDYDSLVIVCSRPLYTSRHYATIRTVMFKVSSANRTYYRSITGATLATLTQNFTADSQTYLSSTTSTTPYGIYPYSVSIADGKNLTITFYRRYNSGSTGTINGTYTAYIYGQKASYQMRQ